MKHHAECRAWCDRGLELDPGHEELLRMRGEAVTNLKVSIDQSEAFTDQSEASILTSDQSQAAERDERKRALEAKRRAVEEGLVLDMIKARGIKVASIKVIILDDFFCLDFIIMITRVAPAWPCLTWSLVTQPQSRSVYTSRITAWCGLCCSCIPSTARRTL